MDTTRPLCLLSVVFAAYSVQLLHTLYTGFTHMQVMEIRYVFDCSVVRLELATLLSYSSLAERWPQVPHNNNRNLALLYLHSLHSWQEPLKYKIQSKMI